MKKILFLSFLIFTFLNTKAEKDTINAINEISVVVSDFVDAGIHLRYERKLSNQFAFCFGAAYKGEDGLINISGLNTDRIKTSNIAYSGFKFVPELRYYFKKTQQYNLDGFYTGFYLKRTSFNSNISGTYTNRELEKYTIDIDAGIRILSIGFSIGYKLAITDRFNIDFLMAGPGVGFYKIGLTPRLDLPTQFYEDLNSVMKNFSYFDATNPRFDFDYVTTKSKFTTVSFRYGLSVGFTF